MVFVYRVGTTWHNKSRKGTIKIPTRTRKEKKESDRNLDKVLVHGRGDGRLGYFQVPVERVDQARIVVPERQPPNVVCHVELQERDEEWGRTPSKQRTCLRPKDCKSWIWTLCCEKDVPGAK